MAFRLSLGARPAYHRRRGDDSVMTTLLSDDIEAFLNYCLDQNRSRKTVSTYRQVLLDFAGWLQRSYPRVDGIGKVDRFQVQAYARALRLRPVESGHSSHSGSAGELSVRTRAKYLAV